MNLQWNADLPESYRDNAIIPVNFEHHADIDARARKEVGFDKAGRRCFYRHEFTLVEDRFDADEFPIQVDVYWERVVAWRLASGRWLKLKTWADGSTSVPSASFGKPRKSWRRACWSVERRPRSLGKGRAG